MNRSLPAALVAAFFILSGCWHQVDGGPEASETRSLDAYSHVRLEGGLTAHFKPGEPSVTIDSQQKVIENLDTVVRQGVLVVRVKPGVKVSSLEWTTINITGSDVTRLEASGGSTLNATALAGRELAIEASGGSHVDAAGAVTSLDIDASGGSTVNAHAASEAVKVDASGGSVVELTATGSVRGEASGGSRVRVAGGGDLSNVESSGGSVVSVLEE